MIHVTKQTPHKPTKSIQGICIVDTQQFPSHERDDIDGLLKSSTTTDFCDGFIRSCIVPPGPFKLDEGEWRLHVCALVCRQEM